MPGEREHGHEEYARHDPGAQPSGEEDEVPGATEGAHGAEASPAGGDAAPDPGAADDADGAEAGDDATGAAERAEAETTAASADDALADPVRRLSAERDEYLDLLRRERAEFENYRRRTNKERQEALDRGAEQLVSGLLSVLDNFGHVVAGADESDHEQLVKGVEMVHREMWTALSEAGLEQVPGEGAPFDPNHHEAMMQVEAEESTEEPYVAEVLKPGYRFKGRVLRPASVTVAQ